MADSRLIEVADAAAAAIAAAWGPAEPDRCTREYGPELDFAALAGRRVMVFPTADGEAGRVSRSEVENYYRLTVLAVEKYEPVGLPPRAWMDERVRFVDQKVYAPLNVTFPADFLLGSLVTYSIDRPVAYDFEVYEAFGAFWSEVEVEFRETVTG